MDTNVPETLPPVRTDSTLLERALANVIDNAVRFSPPGRRVRVEAGAFAGRIDLRVIDQGPGIPRQDRDHVFQPFQRLGDTHAGMGVGLGLAVARGFLALWGPPSRSMTRREAVPLSSSRFPRPDDQGARRR